MLPLKNEGYCLNKKEFWDLEKLSDGHYHDYLPYAFVELKTMWSWKRFYNPKTQPYQKFRNIIAEVGLPRMWKLSQYCSH